MRAIVLSRFGNTDNFKYQDIARPVPGAGEVLIRVHYISINPVDAKTRSGKGLASRLKDIQPLILGWDVSGTVETVGPNVRGFEKGDAVFGMINFPGHGQAYAEFAVAPASHLAKIPAGIDFAEAAATTLAALTAVRALRLMEVKAGDRVLIHAAAGGVGHFAIQIAKHLGAWVAGTASEKNRIKVQSLGADEFIDYQAEELSGRLSGIDAVLDTIGGETIDDSVNVMKPGGTIVSIVSGRNDQVSEKAAATGMKGKAMLVNSNDGDIELVAAYLAKRILKPIIYKIYSFSEMAEAHDQIESGTTAGKVLVQVKGSA